MLSVLWLETASQIVKLIFGLLIDGIINGNNETPAVIMTPTNISAVEISPNAGLLSFENTNALSAIANARTGKVTVHARSV